MQKMSVVLLSGGIGLRMGSPLPKQYLRLNGKLIARYSFEIFLNMIQVEEIVVVCAPEYQHFFESSKKIKFANPGNRRQDSVFNGLKATEKNSKYVCIHDAVRPFIDENMVLKTFEAAQLHGAATLAMPIKFTIKEADENTMVRRTPDRSKIWEIQTPQIIRRDLLEAGFAYANENQITVTDDVSFVELLSQPVKLVKGHEKNLKISTPQDLKIAETLLEQIAYYREI